jgi:hypothetical protein
LAAGRGPLQSATIRKPIALFGAVVLSTCRFVGALTRLRLLAIR